jgi:hypothetical protein
MMITVELDGKQADHIEMVRATFRWHAETGEIMIQKELCELLLAAGVDRDREGQPIVYARSEPWAEKQPSGLWLIAPEVGCRVAGDWVDLGDLVNQPRVVRRREEGIFRHQIEGARDSGWEGLRECAKAALQNDDQARAACLALHAASELVDAWNERAGKP